MKKRYLILLTIITAISMICSGFSLWGEQILNVWSLKMTEKKLLSSPESVAIIGGADGPTSIFIATKISNVSALLLYIITILFMCITVISYIMYFRRHTKKEG